MSLERDFVLNGMLRHNYFPSQSETNEELPPVFTTRSFSRTVVEVLISGKTRPNNDFQGYDSVEFRLTRFNGVARKCSIPHPVAYANLATCIYENWSQLDFISENRSSLSRPRECSDGRLFKMSYEDDRQSTRLKIENSFGHRYLVHADISNFYPSIYSHAIPWALVGHKIAKKQRGWKYQSLWFNQLDEKVRLLKRGETQGIAIGPATSSIISELILAKVDEKLQMEFKYTRFIDDFTAFFETEDRARTFIRRLGEELTKYNLLLNLPKTKILPLPHAFKPDWISELKLSIPLGEGVTGSVAFAYISLALKLARETPDGSVLKYAVRCLVAKEFAAETGDRILRYLLNLSFFQPSFLPLLDRLFDANLSNGQRDYSRELRILAIEHAREHRSDAVVWILYFIHKCGFEIDESAATDIEISRDCLSLLLLYKFGNSNHKNRVIRFVNSLDRSDLYELDQYWVLLYELYRDNAISSPYPTEDAFEIMASQGVHFFSPLSA